MQDNGQDTDPSQHSPWELFDEGISPEQMRAEAPSVDAAESQRLQSAFKQLMRTRKYQLFCDTPSPDAVYATGDAGLALHLLKSALLLICLTLSASWPSGASHAPVTGWHGLQGMARRGMPMGDKKSLACRCSSVVHSSGAPATGAARSCGPPAQ